MGKAASTVTVGQYLHGWIQSRKPDLAPATWRQYDQHLRLYIVPELGKTRLVDLSSTDIRSMLVKLEKGQRTRHHALMTLNAALNMAVDDELIASNPARRVKMAKGKSRTASLTVEEGTRLLSACEAEDSLYADAVAFALLTGLRHGEVLGLRWSDVEGVPVVARPEVQRPHTGASPSVTSITVRQALQRVTGQGMVVRPPKTAAGERTIALGPRAAAVLSRVKGRQKVVRLGIADGDFRDARDAGRSDRAGAGRIRDGDANRGIHDSHSSGDLAESRRRIPSSHQSSLVFHGVKETALRRHFKILLARAECPPVRFHDLRHSCATLMRGLLDTKGIADHLGHADAGVTARLYQHHSASLNAQAVLAYEALFERHGMAEAGRDGQEASG